MMNEKKVSPRRCNRLDLYAGAALLLALSSASILLIAPPAYSIDQAATDISRPIQKTFATPKAAADALIQAAEVFDVTALKQILGPDSEALVSSGDPIRDKNLAAAFAAKAHEKNSMAADSKNVNRVFLAVGKEEWPYPIPIVKRNGQWFFDTRTGIQEILFRRIGSNELDAIQISRGYVEAQREYALEKHDGSEVNQYAQRIISTPGKRDGLVWRNQDGSLGGPIAEPIAKALEEGYSDRTRPYHGYYFKILKEQGPSAPLGQMNFVVNGVMIGGFALAAAPAEYRGTGVKSFIVSYQGIVYEKDLGPDTQKIFSNMKLFDPDKTWRVTTDNWPP